MINIQTHDINKPRYKADNRDEELDIYTIHFL